MSAAARSGFFQSRDGTQLYYECHEPAGSPLACVVILHGYDDHAGRSGHLSERLADEGFRAFAFDYRGHGRAGGRRGHCVRFEDYLQDLDSALAVAADTPGTAPLVLLGHSHGGLVAMSWLCDGTRSSVDAAVFASPYLAPAFRLRWYEPVALSLTSRFVPTLSFDNRLQAKPLTHDAEAAAMRDHDPLFHGVATARWCTEVARAQREIADRVDRLAVPSLWLVPGDDQVADSQTTLQRYEAVQADKDIRVYSALYHELFNELQRDQVIGDLLAWLHARFPRGESRAARPGDP